MPQVELTLNNIHMSDEQAQQFRDWMRLPPEAKDAGLRIAQMMASEDKRLSFYKLLEAQKEISDLLLFKGRITWLGSLVFRIAAFATAILTLVTFYLVLTGKKIL